MPRSLSEIPLGVPITDKSGAITIFFRQLWGRLIAAFPQSPTVGNLSKTGQTAALATTNVYTTATGGLLRLSYWIKKTIADGVSSSLTVTFGFTRNGIALTQAFAALTTDTTSAFQTDALSLIRVDAGSSVTMAIAYASNTPAKMTYEADCTAELLVTS